jgi:hypothetical protein
VGAFCHGPKPVYITTPYIPFTFKIIYHLSFIISQFSFRSLAEWGPLARQPPLLRRWKAHGSIDCSTLSRVPMRSEWKCTYTYPQYGYSGYWILYTHLEAVCTLAYAHNLRSTPYLVDTEVMYTISTFHSLPSPFACELDSIGPTWE